MKNKLRFFLIYSLLWLSFFIVSKLIFLLVNYELSLGFLKLWPKIVYKGFPLDLSALGYVLIFPALILLISGVLSGKWVVYVIKTYTWLLLFVFSILVVADLVIYPDWGFRLDISPLYYMKSMSNAMASVSKIQVVLLLLISSIIPLPFIYALRRIMISVNPGIRMKNYSTIPVFIFMLAFLFLPIRGGFGTAPVNTGSVYFHENNFVNHACLNLPWNIIYSVTNVNDFENPFLKFPELETMPIMHKGMKNGKQESILTSAKPNILLIILESFTANVVGSLNDKYSITPTLDSLANNGLLFTNFYASGDRSDKGLVSILSSYPSLPTTAIIKYPNKTEKIPGLAQALNQEGYNSAFYYGGDINFANMRSYMISCGFGKLVSMVDFPAKQRVSSWGVPDEFLFEKLKTDIENSEAPFFKVAFTLSSHVPYDIPKHREWYPGTDNLALFFNSIAYTDYYLGQFIRDIQASGKLDNTLVILVADHGSSLPGNVSNSSPEKYHIPLVWYGGALSGKYKSQRIEKYGSQTDIASTLLTQLGIDDSQFIFGQNLMDNSYTSETFFAFRSGFAYLSDKNRFIYSLETDKPSLIQGELSDSLFKQGILYYQNLYTHFLSLK